MKISNGSLLHMFYRNGYGKVIAEDTESSGSTASQKV